MTINPSDVSVAVNGDIRWTGGAGTTYTVLELHRFLQDLADNDASSGDDLVDITSSTPSERSTDNIITLLGTYNIDDTMSEHLYDGSIKQGTGGTEKIYSGLRVLGAVNDTDTTLQVVQNNALFQAGTPFWGSQATGGLNGNATAGILMRCLIKSRSDGADIDGKRIRVQARHWGDTYDFFNVTLGEGEAVAAIGTTPDAQNTTLQATVTAYTHVTNTEGYQTIDLNNGNGAQPYYSQWTYGANTSGDELKGVWEFIKDLTGRGTVKTLHGINGELFLGITHEWDYTGEAGAGFQEDELLSWGSTTSSGTSLLLALDDNGATGTVWVQNLTGIVPVDTVTFSGVTTTTTATVNGAPTSRTVPKVFLGSYTGTLIGAFGIGIKNTDLTASDTIQDLLGVTQTPPNNVTFTVSSLVANEDYVLVGPKDVGLAFDFDQLTLNTSLNGAGETAVVVTAAIPSDTPATGTIRIQLDDGRYRKIAYTSWTGSTFTIAPTSFVDPNDATAPRNVMISYIDRLADETAEAFTCIFGGSRNLYVRVRDGGGTPIKTYESAAVLGAAGGSAVASRISDA